MSSEHRTASGVDRGSGAPLPGPGSGLPGRDHRPIAPSLSDDTRIAVEIRGLVVQGTLDAARERFAELVAIHQRRAMRIAYQYLHDPAEADEAVQDAFVKAFG